MYISFITIIYLDVVGDVLPSKLKFHHHCSLCISFVLCHIDLWLLIFIIEKLTKKFKMIKIVWAKKKIIQKII